MILLLVTAFGIKASVLVVATSLVLLPGVARIVRSATLEVSTRGYVESAIARGEPTRALLLREVLPNISGIVTADLGLRFSWSIILIASVNFLGIGIQPPTPDWGVMISENRVVLGSNPMAVIAPSVMLGVLIVGVNLIGDAYVRHSIDRRANERRDRTGPAARRRARRGQGCRHGIEAVTLELKRGEIVCLVGESGSGKTTTALTAFGYCSPTSRSARAGSASRARR